MKCIGIGVWRHEVVVVRAEYLRKAKSQEQFGVK